MAIISPVYYFQEPGEKNTDLVVEAVTKRLSKSDITTIVLASTRGNTALKFSDCIPGWQYHG